ncbi:MAG: aconitate hydratase AcnA [Thermoguttaceae bacterium]|nr:aconitate hydratase AcnA [Thermoguttaceae bacterium]MDW8037992.1 aconitate hydratase AcnA [Thermoguttaceae bacterium]
MSGLESMTDLLEARSQLSLPSGKVGFYRLSRVEELGWARLAELPYCIRVLLESLVRHCDGQLVRPEEVEQLARWRPEAQPKVEVPFLPARVLLQDFTGLPCMVDLAAMRAAVARLGGDPQRVNPLVPVDLVIDHSLQVDFYGSADALSRNVALEFERNQERYIFLRWSQKAFGNFRVIPPSVGIIHQVNLEFLASCVSLGHDHAGPVAYPDSVLGTDSHTTTINGLGVVGWGVGGIEAEAVMLGQPVGLCLPEVVGVELVGQLPAGATATDVVLMLTQELRRVGVVGKFLEFFGPSVRWMGVPDRATLANMAPEYGATMAYFPFDEQTLAYLRQTGRSEMHLRLVEEYTKEQFLWRSPDAPVPRYSQVLTFDLSRVEPSVAGPKRPQDRVPIGHLPEAFRRALEAPVAERGFGLSAQQRAQAVPIEVKGQKAELRHGSVVLAAITSCTNTSNPTLMLAAGLLAEKAVRRGLRVPPYVKTSLAPGSQAVTEYLAAAGLERPLQMLGFHTVGYGCATCIGNSGPLPEQVAQAIEKHKLVVAAVLSGNRNFEGRIHPLVRANYLASPPLVVAYALAGRIDIDLHREPIGKDPAGQPVFLRDIWPTPQELAQAAKAILPEMFRRPYARLHEASPLWNLLPTPEGALYAWDPASTYLQQPPFLDQVDLTPPAIQPIRQARILALLGDSITTDHISPAGPISPESPAGAYLRSLGLQPEEFHTYGARRGNHQVMVRGSFANLRLRNHLVADLEGGYTRHFPSGDLMTIYEAAMRYQQEGVPLVIMAGAEYGCGSSRDWAAKGTALLGVRAVVAQSFERIHRSNLIGMGVLPLEFLPGQGWQTWQLTGQELIDIPELNDQLQPRQILQVLVQPPTGASRLFQVKVRIDTPLELQWYRHGGILPMMLRKLLADTQPLPPAGR